MIMMIVIDDDDDIIKEVTKKEEKMVIMVIVIDDDDIIKKATKKEEKTNTKEGPGWPGLSIKVETFPHSTKEKAYWLPLEINQPINQTK